jgi:hypothetical protein
LNDASECVISIELQKFRSWSKVVAERPRQWFCGLSSRVAKHERAVLQNAAEAMRRFHSRQAVPMGPQIVES